MLKFLIKIFKRRKAKTMIPCVKCVYRDECETMYMRYGCYLGKEEK